MAAIRFQRDLLAQVVQRSRDAIMAFRAIRDDGGAVVDFEWLLVNNRAGHLMGATQDKLIGTRLRASLANNKRHELFDHYVQVVDSGRPFDWEQSVELNGRVAWFHVIADKLGDGLCVTMTDITRFKVPRPPS